MLAVLLVMVLAATFALVVVGAVHSMQMVEGADASGWRAAAAERQALAAVAAAAALASVATAGVAQGGDAGAGGVVAGRRGCRLAAAPATGWPRVAASTSPLPVVRVAATISRWSCAASRGRWA